MSDENVWGSDVVKQIEKESSGGGKGWVCRTNVVLGYKVFAKGMSNDETFFPYKIGDDESKKKARYDAVAFKDNYNESAVEPVTRDPSNAIRIELDKDNVFGKETTTWTGNRVQDTTLWSDTYKELISPKLQESNAGEGWQWCLIKWAPDPYAVNKGRKVVNQVTGEEMTPLAMYVDKTFLTKQEALDYAAEIEAGVQEQSKDGSPPFKLDDDAPSDVPEGYDADSWLTVVPMIKDALADGQPVKQIAEDYGISVGEVVKLKK